MPSYNLIKEFSLKDDEANEAISVDPHWVIAVIRFAYPVTYSRAFDGSFSTHYPDGVKVRGKPLIITDNAIQVTVSSSKSSHISQMSATLLQNYTNELIPGDWVFVWMMHDKATQNRIIQAIQKSEPANDFNSGLKFVGRLNAFRKQIVVDPNVGTRITRYHINACGFTEFDATLYYEPHLAQKFPQLGQYWAAIGGALNAWIERNGQGVSTKDALVFFLDLFMGQGVPVNLGRGNRDPRLTATAGLAAPYSYIVPSVVGDLLGKNQKKNQESGEETQKSEDGGALVYADILEFLYGVQSYGNPTFTDENPGPIFNPEGARSPGSRRWTGTQMLGNFIPVPPHFTDRSVWSVLRSYLNPAVNELYTALRPNPDGRVVPTLVARQIPFSTDFAPSWVPVTKFLDLPRWKVHPIMVKSCDLGRSDALRVNFVHIYGQTPGKHTDITGQIVRWPPMRDDLDIARNGLRSYMATVPCVDADIQNGDPKKWMAIIADIMMGAHMTLTGTVEMIGVQSPICPGDNLEWDDVVFHVESVTHVCSINPSTGVKSFHTVVALSHGVSAHQDLSNFGDLGIYAGIDEDDQRSNEAPLSVEGDDPNGGEKAPANQKPGAVTGGVYKIPDPEPDFDPTKVLV